MNLKLRDSVKNYLDLLLSFFNKGIRIKRKIKKEIIKILPHVNVIDIGASYYPHSKWSVFMNSKNTFWLAVDPNFKNLKYTKDWHWASKINKSGKAIAAKKGEETLFITNVDSGSSLLKPVLKRKIFHRHDENYFFPFKKTDIQVISLNDLIKDTPDNFFILKLDTQGTEFDILKNLDLNFWDKILCIELESNLNYEPSYEKSSNVNEVFKFFRKKEFELIDIKVIRNQKKLTSKSLKSKFIPNESDLVFGINSSKIIQKGLDCSKIMIGVYESYGLYEEIHFLSNEMIKNFELNVDDKHSIINIIKNLS